MPPRASLALLLSSALLLTGCGADTEPQPKFEAETSATPTVVKEETAEEFLKRWAEVERDMQNTGETKEYRAITKGCESCERLADRVEKIYEDGGWLKAGDTTIQQTENKGSNVYLVWVSTEPTTHSFTKEGPDGSFDGGEGVYEVNLIEQEGQWRMTHLVKTPE